MKIVKKDLIKALDQTRQFTGVSLPILKKVLIDGPGQKVVANNLDCQAIASVAITDYVQKITGEKPKVNHPTDEFRAELTDLKKAQLVTMCEDYGVESTGTKADLIDRIYAKAEENAQREEAEAVAPEAEVEEKFCVDPVHLLKIVRSLEASEDAEIDLNVQEFQADDDLLAATACRLSVGGLFSSLTIEPAENFPGEQEFEGTRLLDITGDSLAMVTNVPINDSKETRALMTTVMIDADLEKIVATDGKRMHMISQKFVTTADKKLLLSGKALKAISTIAKANSIEVQVDSDYDWASFNIGKLAVLLQSNESEYPDYMETMTREMEHTVQVDRKTLLGAFKQADLVSDDDYRGAELTFNGNLNIAMENVNVGEYSRENIPFLNGTVEPEIKVHMNVKFLTEVVRGLKEKVTFRLNDCVNPMFLSSDKGFSACIMPIRAE